MRGLRLLWLGAALGVARPVSAVAQPGWDAVTGLTPRTFVRIERLDGSGIQARVSAVDDAQIVVGEGRKAIVIARADVRRIERANGTYAKEKFRNGFLVGAGIGSLIIIASVPAVAIMAPLWGGIGAAIGFTDGVAERKYTVIYEAAALPNRDRP